MIKKSFFLTILMAFALTSCYQNEDEISSNEKYVAFNLNAQGVDLSSMTRATFNEPQNLLVIDQFEDKCTVSERTGLASFGLPLAYGTHELYFIAATAKWESYDTDKLIMKWTNTVAGMREVWAYHLTLEVDENTTVEEITLPLVVADVRIKTLDKIPTGTSVVNVEANDLCRALNLTTMKGGVITSQPVNANLDVSSAAGKTLQANFYTFVPAAGNVGDINVTALDASSKEIAAKMLNAVPVQEGYISLYTGYFFSEGVTIPLTYTDDWTGVNEYQY